MYAALFAALIFCVVEIGKMKKKKKMNHFFKISVILIRKIQVLKFTVFLVSLFFYY